MKRLRTRSKKFLRVLCGKEPPAFVARRMRKGPPAPDDEQMAAILGKAERLLESGDRGGAASLLAGVSRPYGIRLIRRKRKARLQQKSGDRAGALEEWLIVRRKAPRNQGVRKRIRKLETRIHLADARRHSSAGDHHPAIALLEPILARNPRHSRALRLLLHAMLASGDVQGAEARARTALAAKPKNPKPLHQLAAACEAAGRDPETLRLWDEIAGRADHDDATRLARVIRASRGASAGKPAPANADTPPPADEWLRLADERSLFRHLAGLAGRPAADAATRRYYECRMLYQHHGFADALAAAESLAADPDFARASGAAAEIRLAALADLRARCLARTGRHAEAYALSDRLAGDPVRKLETELDLCWREDPARGLAAATRLWCGPDAPDRTSLLFCALPLALGEPDRAARHLRMDLARREARRRSVPADLILCAAEIRRAHGDLTGSAALAGRYFGRFSLETPEGLGGSFDSIRLAFDWKLETGPLVTVILTAHNAENTVAQALLSLLRQSHGNLEIIAIDDASTDATSRVLAETAAADPRVAIYRNQRNAGTYVSKNFALGIARGEYFTFMDADDWAHPRRVERHLARMRTNPALAATTSDWVRVDENCAPVLKPWPAVFTHSNPGSLFCHASVREEIGYFDAVRIDADMDYRLRVRARYGPSRMARVAAPLTLGRHHSASLTRSGQGAQDAEGYSKIRSDYRAATFRWRVERLLNGQTLHLGPGLHERDLPSAAPIRVHEHPEPVRIK